MFELGFASFGKDEIVGLDKFGATVVEASLEQVLCGRTSDDDSACVARHPGSEASTDRPTSKHPVPGVK
jgi:hypothetical protein